MKDNHVHQVDLFTRVEVNQSLLADIERRRTKFASELCSMPLHRIPRLCTFAVANAYRYDEWCKRGYRVMDETPESSQPAEESPHAIENLFDGQEESQESKISKSRKGKKEGSKKRTADKIAKSILVCPRWCDGLAKTLKATNMKELDPKRCLWAALAANRKAWDEMFRFYEFGKAVEGVSTHSLGKIPTVVTPSEQFGFPSLRSRCAFAFSFVTTPVIPFGMELVEYGLGLELFDRKARWFHGHFRSRHAATGSFVFQLNDGREVEINGGILQNFQAIINSEIALNPAMESVAALCSSTMAYALGNLHLLPDPLLCHLWNDLVQRAGFSCFLSMTSEDFKKSENKVFVLGVLLLRVVKMTSRFVYNSDFRQNGVLMLSERNTVFKGTLNGVKDVGVHIFRLVVQLIHDKSGVCVYRKTTSGRDIGWRQVRCEI